MGCYLNHSLFDIVHCLLILEMSQFSFSYPKLIKHVCKKLLIRQFLIG